MWEQQERLTEESPICPKTCWSPCLVRLLTSVVWDFTHGSAQGTHFFSILTLEFFILFSLYNVLKIMIKIPLTSCIVCCWFDKNYSPNQKFHYLICVSFHICSLCFHLLVLFLFSCFSESNPFTFFFFWWRSSVQKQTLVLTIDSLINLSQNTSLSSWHFQDFLMLICDGLYDWNFWSKFLKPVSFLKVTCTCCENVKLYFWTWNKWPRLKDFPLPHSCTYLSHVYSYQ